MLNKFFDYLRFERRYSEHTLTAYQHDLQQFIDFAGIHDIHEFINLKSTLIRSWMVSLLENAYSKRSVNRKLATLRSLFKWLRKEGLSDGNPMLKITGPKVEKRLPIFAKETELDQDKSKLLFGNNFSGFRDELIFEFLYQTGIRLNELVQLKHSDVKSDSIKVLGKRNKERLIPISAELLKKINHYRFVQNTSSSNNFFFTLDNGKPLYPAFVYRKIHDILGSLTNLDKRSPHVLRHTFATHMLNRGAGLETLKDLLGHASLAATQVYTHNSFAQLTKIYANAHPRSNSKF